MPGAGAPPPVPPPPPMQAVPPPPYYPPQPQVPASPPPGMQKPADYLVGSIIVSAISLLTCHCLSLIFGIISIVFGTKVGPAWRLGDYAGAENASNTAKTWFWVALIVYLVGLVIGVILLLTGVIANLHDLH